MEEYRRYPDRFGRDPEHRFYAYSCCDLFGMLSRTNDRNEIIIHIRELIYLRINNNICNVCSCQLRSHNENKK